MYASSEEGHALAGFLPCGIVDIAVRLPEAYARVMLRCDSPTLPTYEIPISIEQGRQLSLILRGQRAPRPLSGELASDIITAYGVTIVYVAITGVCDGTVLAEVATMGEGQPTKVFPARPSDAIMLALLGPVPAPILVNPEILTPPEGRNR
ncbi:MAG: bifunctional nuclease family protein [Ferrimicrobium sp.]